MLYSRGENNCEHLVNWALSGHHHCDQTDTGQGVVYVGFGFVSWLVNMRKAHVAPPSAGGSTTRPSTAQPRSATRTTASCATKA